MCRFLASQVGLSRETAKKNEPQRLENRHASDSRENPTILHSAESPSPSTCWS